MPHRRTPIQGLRHSGVVSIAAAAGWTHLVAIDQFGKKIAESSWEGDLYDEATETQRLEYALAVRQSDAVESFRIAALKLG